MDERFPLTGIPPEVAEIAGRLLDAGHEAWYVGGAIRDSLLRAATRAAPAASVRDFDIATSARPEEVQKLFKRTVPVGIEHGTVAVLDKANKGHEVTTFRRDVKTDGRHAEVEFGVSLDDDLARRDFTINALAVHPRSGELRDPYGGMADLRQRVLRAVGEPERRFREDRLRVLRGLRFSAALGFAIEPDTMAALRASASELGHLSRERVRDEWVKTLSGAGGPATVQAWRDAGVLTEVWPELAPLGATVDIPAVDPVLTTAALLSRAGASPKAAAAAAERLKLSSKDVTRIAKVVGALLKLPDPNDGRGVRWWMSDNFGVEDDAAGVAPADVRQALLITLAAEKFSGVTLAIRELAVTGEDLKAAGVPAGPQMGKVLRMLLELVLDDPSLNTKEQLLSRVTP